MAERAKHAFGSSDRILEALEKGLVDAYDILFLDGDTDNPKVGWIDAQGNPVIVQDAECVIEVEALPNEGESGKIYLYKGEGYFWDGKEWVNLCKPTDVSALEAEIATKADAAEVEAELATKATTKEVETKVEQAATETEKAANSYTDDRIVITEKVKYEITGAPVGTLVDYRDKEIRVMCPVNTVWTKQNVGSTGNANMYYMGFKAYAPEEAVSFKEGDRGVIVDEMFDFNGDFAGVDKYGRKYSICWLALASYDATAKTWTYFGKNSSEEKYIGWDYCVEWYNADGIVIAADAIRINLSNEECHSTIKPYYMADVENSIEVIEF